MKVKDILKEKNPKVWTIHETSTIHDALGILVQQKIGALIVTDSKENIRGILSERDIIRVCYQDNPNVERTVIGKVMTENLIVGTPEDEVDYIMGIMTNNRVRHIPIIQEGKLVGIISIGDIVKAQIRDTQYENRYLKDYMFGPEIKP